MNQIVGPLACLAITVALAGCSADDGSESCLLRFTSRIGPPGARQREWTFGDGSTSSEQNPTRDTNAVVAEVTLTVSRCDVEDSVTKVISTPEC